MSEETPAQASEEKKPAAAEKPVAVAEKPAEIPFSVDVLKTCTARFTNTAWYLFLNNQNDLNFIRTAPLRATLTCRTADGAEEIHRQLVEAGVQEISRQDRDLHFTATFEQIQTVIRQPQAYLLNAAKL